MNGIVYGGVVVCSLTCYASVITMEGASRVSTESVSTEQVLRDVKRVRSYGKQCTRQQQKKQFDRCEWLLNKYELRTLDRKLTDAEKRNSEKVVEEMAEWAERSRPIVCTLEKEKKEKIHLNCICALCKKIREKREKKE